MPDRASPREIVTGMARETRRGAMARREFLTLATTFGLGATAARGLLGAAAAQAPEPVQRRGGTLRVAMLVRPMRDPRLFDWSEMGNIARQVVEPLVRLSADGALEPWLLSGWQTAPDAAHYRLRLRRGVRWSNGDPFTAEDVIANLRRWCDSSVPGNSMAARCSALIDPFTGQLREGAVAVIDDHTVELYLARPDITLMAGLADYPALVVHRSFDETGADITAAPIGTGPFRLVAFEPGLRARVERAETWWGGEVPLDAVEWRHFGTNPVAELNAFADGTIDLNYETAADYVGRLDALGLDGRSLVSANTIVARMNQHAPPFDDLRVRRAIQLAVDNGVVLALGYAGEGLAGSNTHVGPMHPDHAGIEARLPNPAEARRLLTEAGRADHEFELISIDDDWRRNTADAIAVQLLDAGIRIRRTLVPAAQFWRDWRQYPFSTTNWAARPLGVQTMALAYRSGSAWNETGFADRIFDAALETALGMPDDAGRRLPMAVMEARLRDSGVIIQPYWRRIFVHAAPRVRGFRLHPAFEQHLESVWLREDT